MRRSNSQPYLAKNRSYHDLIGSDAYATNELSKLRLREAAANRRARELEAELDTRKSKVQSFASARPLSRSEADAFQREEHDLRRLARLSQVREKERVNAAVRRQKFAAVQKHAAGSNERMTRYHNSDYALHVPSYSAFNQNIDRSRYDQEPKRSLSRRRVNSIESVPTSTNRTNLYSEADIKSGNQRGIHLPSPSNEDYEFDLFEHRKNRMSYLPSYRAEKYVDDLELPEFVRGFRHNPESHSAERRNLSHHTKIPVRRRDLPDNNYEGLDQQQQQYQVKQEHRIRERLRGNANIDDYKYRQRPIDYDSKWHFLPEEPNLTNAYKVPGNRNRPDDPHRGKHRSQDLSADSMPLDLKVDDIIVLDDDGISLERPNEQPGEKLASTTWFVLAKEDISDESSYDSDRSLYDGSSPSMSEVRTNLKTASRLLLESEESDGQEDQSVGTENGDHRAPSSKPQPISPQKAAVIERLRRGERPKLSREEMRRRTQQSYFRLPEVAEQRREILKREDEERRRRMVQQMDKKRRDGLLGRHRKSG